MCGNFLRNPHTIRNKHLLLGCGESRTFPENPGNKKTIHPGCSHTPEFSVQCMFLGQGRKPEIVEETHTDACRTCRETLFRQ